MKPTNLIHIVNFSSIHAGMNQSGFSIVLHKDFANAVVKIKRESGETVTKGMRSMIVQSLGEFNLQPNALSFVGDSWLLDSIRVGGNCACFSSGLFDGGEHYRHVKFEPHNIDNPLQAATVLSVWLFWFNTISSLTDFELPYCV